ncbi:MAG: hypothetical protein PHE51_07975 [Eubacteriales bacterium]|nr:hypothetical protein [Eubacteriales bacterium]
MKKIVTLIMAVILCMGTLTGCFSDPVADEFEKFLNTDMVEANALYEDLKAEVSKWEGYTTSEELINSVDTVILPNLEQATQKVEAIELATDEVNSIREKYKKMLGLYKEGYELTLSGLKADDEKIVEDANAKIEEGLKILEEYNKALEDLAAEKGLTIEY